MSGAQVPRPVIIAVAVMLCLYALYSTGSHEYVCDNLTTGRQTASTYDNIGSSPFANPVREVIPAETPKCPPVAPPAPSPSFTTALSASGLDHEYILNCNNRCGKFQRCFLGKCFCLPGRAGPQCAEHKVPEPYVKAQFCPVFDSLADMEVKPVTHYPVEHCRVTHERNSINCGLFCYWQEDAGVAQVTKANWEQVSNGEFTIWKAGENAIPEDRNAEHAEGLDNFRALPNDLGNYLEIGSGPYSQTNNIMTVRRDAKFKNIYLAEPNIFRYLSLKNCVYRDGSIKGHRVNLLSLPVEELPAKEFFDTVLSINVIEHVYNAMDFLTAMYNAVKPGGILVFGERYFDDPDRDTEVLGPATLHPIRLKRVFLQHFLRLFDVLYLGDHNTSYMRSRRPANEVGFYFIGRKKTKFTEADEPSKEELDRKYPAQPFNKIYGNA